MKRSFVAVAGLCLTFGLAPKLALAQQASGSAQVYSACGAAAFTLGHFAPLTQLANGELCTNATGGGGGGGGAVYGPTAVGSAVANPPVETGFQDGSGNVAIVTPSIGLPVNVIGGSVVFAGTLPNGSASNASSAVATSSNQLPTNAFLYLFNGTTYDQAQDDASKNLKVALQTGDTYENAANWIGGTASTTAGTATTLVAASGASLKSYITDLSCYNTSATTITVALNDSLSTVLIVPSTGGNNLPIRVPLQTAANTALTFTASTAETTVGCTARGYKGS